MVHINRCKHSAHNNKSFLEGQINLFSCSFFLFYSLENKEIGSVRNVSPSRDGLLGWKALRATRPEYAEETLGRTETVSRSNVALTQPSKTYLGCHLSYFELRSEN